MNPIRILITEDEPLFRDMLRTALEKFPELQVIGSAANGQEAIDAGKQLHPDVVLMDIELGPGPNGIQAGREIKKAWPDTGIVLLSMHADRQYLAGFPAEMAAGWSYLLKQSVGDLQALVRAIQGSACGFVVVDSAVITGLKPNAESNLARLTDRQLEVVQQMSAGYNNAAIAQNLSISEKSVENYVNSIFHEMGLFADEPVHRRVKAVLKYLQETNYIQDPPGG